MWWYVIIKSKVLLPKVRVTVKVQRSNHVSDLTQTAEVNFIELHIKVKHDKMVPFFVSVRIPCQGQGHNQTFCIRIRKQLKQISTNFNEW